jgi:hypothetical protein
MSPRTTWDPAVLTDDIRMPVARGTSANAPITPKAATT